VSDKPVTQARERIAVEVYIAEYQATGYAWGREDASGVPTLPGVGRENETPSRVFGQAYAQGWEDYNQDKRGYMVSVRAAYKSWQYSYGASIFQPDDSTVEVLARRRRVDADRAAGIDVTSAEYLRSRAWEAEKS
jgi:hypothetical protein